MEISEAEFKLYEQVRLSGVTNMFDTRVIEQLTGLTRQQIMHIMEHYDEYKAQFID